MGEEITPASKLSDGELVELLLGGLRRGEMNKDVLLELLGRRDIWVNPEKIILAEVISKAPESIMARILLEDRIAVIIDYNKRSNIVIVGTSIW